jgi:hypothetical protein
MVAAVRNRDRGDIAQATACRLALHRIERPTVEQTAGATLEAYAMRDLHVLAMGLNIKE